MNTRKIVMSSVVAVAVLAAMLVAVPSALAAYDANSTYFNPENSNGAYCQNDTYVEIRVNTSVASLGGGMDIYFDPSCVNVTAVNFSGTPWTQMQGWHNWGNYARISNADLTGSGFSGDNLFATITLHCINGSCNCASSLNFSGINSFGLTLQPHNGTITCAAPLPINLDIRADSTTGNIFDVTSYTVNPGTVTDTDGSHTINNHTAMGATMVYCRDNGINVNVTDSYYGNWLVQIGNNASDFGQWCYAVNETNPGYGADLYSLSGGEKVHWFNAAFNYYAVTTTLNRTQVNVGDAINATVTWTNITGTHLLNGAMVNVTDDVWSNPGTSVGTTGADGNCTFYCTAAGTWQVYAVDPVHGSGQYNWPVPQYTAGVDLTVETPSASCVNGDFTVNITADPNGLEVYGVQYKLTYNASVIRLNMQNEGDFLNQGATTTVYDNTIDNSIGQAAFGVSRKDNTSGTTAQGTVAVLSFTTIGNANDKSDITLSDVVVSDENAIQIYAALTNGDVELCDPNQSPVANASSDHKYNNVGTVFYCKAVLNGSLSNDPDGSITQWLWAFGDGNFDSGEIREHTYASYQWTGSDYTPYIANLTVTDNGGASDDDGCEVQVYIAGEANGDGKVNVLDAAMVGLRWNNVCATYPGVCWGVEEMADRADLNNDCWVNIQDAVTVGANWGNTA